MNFTLPAGNWTGGLFDWTFIVLAGILAGSETEVRRKEEQQ